MAIIDINTLSIDERIENTAIQNELRNSIRLYQISNMFMDSKGIDKDLRAIFKDKFSLQMVLEYTRNVSI